MDMMIKVLKDFLDMIVIVFIDDKLVYSRSSGKYEVHLR